jgi:hypothetical protein
MKIKSISLLVVTLLFCGALTNISYADHDGTNGESVVRDGSGGR